MNEQKNLLIAVVLSSAILMLWQYYYETPRLAEAQKAVQLRTEEKKLMEESTIISSNEIIDVDQALSSSDRIEIKTSNLTGSISLKGARIDDLLMNKYKETINESSGLVRLFSPSNTMNSYFVEFGWLSNSNVELPSSDTIWNSNNKILELGNPVELYWTNSQGIKFIINIAIDDRFMFKIIQEVINNSSDSIKFHQYGLISQSHTTEASAISVLHEGAVAVVNNILEEVTYSDLPDKKSVHLTGYKGDWLGITDKYWLSAIIPNIENEEFSVNFKYNLDNNIDKFQADYLGKEVLLTPGKNYKQQSLLFAGAKETTLLDEYSNSYNINLFDRAVDFGWFYFLTKPMYLVIKYFHDFSGNFGIAIILMTLLVKILMYPLASKSSSSMNKIKNLQPQIQLLKEQYANDKLKFNEKMMELYRKQNINPMSGCLPLLVQVPVFFSLYKVIFVSIEMRHAPFYGWVKDLSVADPTSIANLFGLIPWDPPSIINIGLWPIIMGITMCIQQSLTPQVADPVQAKVMKFLPLIFVVMFHSFPAGLMIYWSFSNLLSILQQWMLMRKSEKKL